MSHDFSSSTSFFLYWMWTMFSSSISVSTMKRPNSLSRWSLYLGKLPSRKNFLISHERRKLPSRNSFDTSQNIEVLTRLFSNLFRILDENFFKIFVMIFLKVLWQLFIQLLMRISVKVLRVFDENFLKVLWWFFIQLSMRFFIRFLQTFLRYVYQNFVMIFFIQLSMRFSVRFLQTSLRYFYQNFMMIFHSTFDEIFCEISSNFW